MGFFTDLKEDLSQAVGELMPEDELLENLPDELLTNDEESLEESVDFSDAEDSAADEDKGYEAPEIPEFETVSDAADEVESDDVTKGLETEDIEIPEAETEEMTVDIGEMLDRVTEMNTMKEGNDFMNEESVYVAAAEAEMMKNDLSDKRVSDETALITAGMTIVGDITSEGSLELEGSVNGNIDLLGKLNVTGNVNGDSKAAEIFADNAKINGEVRSMGSVKIGQSTVIIGNIFANSAVIAGAVKGDIDVMGPVILDTSAIVMGNIKSKSVQINNGAVIEGMCSQCYAEVNPTSFFEEIKKGKK